MIELSRMPTEEDVEKSSFMPSLTVYRERFGSWKHVQDMWGNRNLNKKNCMNCSKEIIFIKKSKVFCSDKCAHQYAMKEKLKRFKPKRCQICSSMYTALDVKHFKKTKICEKKECNEKWTLAHKVRKAKNNKISTALFKELVKFKGNRCHYCDFDKVLKIRLPKGKSTDQKIIQAIKNKHFDYLVVCPNHDALLERKISF
jgi:hypothetical protein